MKPLNRWTVSAAVVLTLASGQAFAQNCAKLGGVIAQTGAQGAIGKVIVEAGRLAVDQVNKAGGVKGRCGLRWRAAHPAGPGAGTAA